MHIEFVTEIASSCTAKHFRNALDHRLLMVTTGSKIYPITPWMIFNCVCTSTMTGMHIDFSYVILYPQREL